MAYSNLTLIGKILFWAMAATTGVLVWHLLKYAYTKRRKSAQRSQT